jgi:hypothetical protein
MMRFFILTMAVVMLGASPAAAVSFTVDALLNASENTPLVTVALTAGQTFSVTAGADDLWSLGPLPRWSNADGLTANRFATGTDESGEAAGTKIGQNWGTHSEFGLSAPFGMLVGEIGGVYFQLGTSFSGTAPATGILRLMNWDGAFDDNTNSITADVTVGAEAVPEPSSLILLSIGGALLGAARRRYRHNAKP